DLEVVVGPVPVAAVAQLAVQGRHLVLEVREEGGTRPAAALPAKRRAGRGQHVLEGADPFEEVPMPVQAAPRAQPSAPRARSPAAASRPACARTPRGRRTRSGTGAP